MRSYRSSVTFSHAELDALALMGRHVGDVLGRRRTHARLRESEEPPVWHLAQAAE